MVCKMTENEDGNIMEHNASGEVVKLNIEQKYTDEQIREYKNDFLEGYFDVEFKDYQKKEITKKVDGVEVKEWVWADRSKQKDGRSFDFIPTPSNKKSKSVIRGLWTRYRRFFDSDYIDFIATIVSLVSDAVIQFNETQATYDYSKMNDDGFCANEDDEKCKCDGEECVKPSYEHQRLHAYIVKAGRNNVSVLENMLQNFTSELEWKKRVGGDIKELPISSLDATIEGADGEQVFVHEMLSEDANLFAQSSNYHAPHITVYFKRWMNEQKILRASKKRADQSAAMLTNEAIQFYEVMKDIYIGPLVTGLPGYSTNIELMKQRAAKGKKTYNEQQIYWFTKTISETFTAHYNELFPFGVSFIGMKRLEDKQVLDEVIAILNPSDPVAVGKIQKKAKGNKQIDLELSQWICNNYHERVVQDIIHDDLTPADLTNINALKIKRKRDVAIDKATLYKFVDAVQERLESIETADNDKPAKWYKRDAKPPEIEAESPFSDIKVYRQGELVEVLPSADFIKKDKEKYKKKLVTPTGAEIDISNSEFEF